MKPLDVGASRPSARTLRPLVWACAALLGLAQTAHATNYNEGAIIGDTGHPDTDVIYEVHDLSSVSSSPTNMGALTRGANVITGATIPYGPVTNAMTGERMNQDNDYVTFTVPKGDLLSSLYLVAPSSTDPDGTTITAGDRFFMGIATGTSVNVTPPSSVGLLGYTLLTSDQIGTDILPALGASDPPGFSGPPFSGATTFDGPLGAGTYTLWMLDGDNPVHYQLDLQVSSAPEPGTWALMFLGLGAAGAALRRSQKAQSLSLTCASTA